MEKIFNKIKVILFIGFLSASLSAIAFDRLERSSIAGNDDAPLTIQIFSDFTCPYCAKGEINIKKILKEYPQKVRIIFRNMPLDSAGSMSDKAARAFSAVYLQDPKLAYNYQAELFQHQSDFLKLGEVFLYDLAEKLKINLNRMKSDMQGPEVEEIIKEDKALAKQLRIQGAPSFMVGHTFFQGVQPYNHVKEAIERQISDTKNCHKCKDDGDLSEK